MTTILHIKNMVCPRCIEAVHNILTNEHIDVESVELGKAVVNMELDQETKVRLSEILKSRGFELLENRNQKIVDEIKSIIIELVHHSGEIPEHLNFSDVLAQKLNSNYRHLSSLFSSSEGITIEKFVILQKVEKVKELISYNNLNISEIAIRMGYSSVSHMSSQFKHHTGLTPSQYAKLDDKDRVALDNLL